jgi:hypothetical protein
VQPTGGQPAAGTKGAPPRACYWCGEWHWERECQHKPPFNPNVVCGQCAQVGHATQHCRTPQCTTCKRFGHPTARCPNRPTTATGAQPPQMAGATARATTAAPTPTHSVSYADPAATTYTTHVTNNANASGQVFQPGPWPSGGGC